MWRGRMRFGRGSTRRRSSYEESPPAVTEGLECPPTDEPWFEACIVSAQQGTNEVEIVLDVPTYRNWS
jgi:hypothetical protein